MRAIALMMEAGSTSETSVNFYQTTQRKTQKTAIFSISFIRLRVVVQNK
jgi:hypothetical protein